jgi:hypothetical protein
MADPDRALTIRDVQIDGKLVAADNIVWVHARTGGQAEVEHRGRLGRIPADAIVPYPVKGPDLEEVRQLDACFGLPKEAFEVEHHSDAYYELLRCRAHGRRFLEDVRGTVGLYTTLTLLDDDEAGSPDEIWRRYHAQSDSWLALARRTWGA